MKRPQHIGQFVDVARRQATLRHGMVPLRVLREGAHADRPVEHRAIAADFGLGDRSGDGQHVEVQRRREPPVQTPLFLAIEAPCGKRAEVEEAQVQRLADLAGMPASQQHERDVGLDDADRARVVGFDCATSTLHQCGDHPRLVGQRDLACGRPVGTWQSWVHVVLEVGRCQRISARGPALRTRP